MSHKTAMRLAQTEYDRFLAMLKSLSPRDWEKPTACPDWDVRAMASHLLGMAEMSASVRESMRQSKAAQGRGGVFIDALTAVQVGGARGPEPGPDRRAVRRGHAEGRPKADAARRGSSAG